jgi:predicted Zn-dependent protease
MFAGLFFNGRDTKAVDVRCWADGDYLRIQGAGVEHSAELADVQLSPRLARTRRVLFLPDGGQVHTDDNDAVDALFPRHNRFEGLVDRLERHWRAAALSAGIALAGTALFFTVGLPWLADRVAQRIPAGVEHAMGEQALDMLRHLALHPSTVEPQRQEALRKRFADFAADSDASEHYEVQFYSAPAIGANAFALPGGTIVFTDDMMSLLENDDEFLAVAAHEIGHERHRHLLRLVLRDSGVAVFGALFAGDVGSASTVVVAIPTFLLQNSYTRGFEADADEYALAALAAHGISPQAFADVMRKLEAKHPELKEQSMAYASTHPPTEERIARAEAAARAYAAAHAATR